MPSLNSVASSPFLEFTSLANLFRPPTTPTLNTTVLITPTFLKARWTLSTRLFKPRCALNLLLLPRLVCPPINFSSSKREIWRPKTTNSCWLWTRASRRRPWLRLNARRSRRVPWTKKAPSASHPILARSASEITSAEKRSDLCRATTPSTTNALTNGWRPRPSRARCARPLWKYFSRSKVLGAESNQILYK